MSAKIISQKKFAKLVASTGALSQPPGALTRLSNLLFTQRGSLQIADGSQSIGQLLLPFIRPVWINIFTQYAIGQYPTYAALATPPTYTLADFTSPLTATPAGTTTNPIGTYYFFIVAKGSFGAVVLNNAPLGATLVAASTFATVNFTWTAVSGATGYDIYYTTTGTPAQGNKILSNIPGAVSGANLIAAFTGALASGTTNLPTLNNSYLLELLIGSVTPPSPVAQFVFSANGTFPAMPPQTAQLAPGDPNFVFDTITTLPQTLTPSTSTGGGSAHVNPDTGESTAAYALAYGWVSQPILPNQATVVYIPAYWRVTVGSRVSGKAIFQYSLDSGATWTTFDTETASGSGLLVVTVPSTLSNISLLQIQVVVSASSDSPTLSATTTAGTTSSVYMTTAIASSFSPYGGIVGFACPIPQCLQFAGQEILVLGNGYPPQQCNPSLLGATTVTPLANTFQDAFPDWQSSVTWLTGAQVTDGSSNYYTATQGGVSGTSAPVWNTTLGAQTADGTVQWTSQGPIVASTAPRGAAHAVAYAGSLWLANTYPANTSDGIDGPSCLKMSDANNPNSWNPVNTAFVGRQDGSQITGLCPFTIAALGISPTGSLCIFKEFTTYQFIGVFGTTSFEIQPAQTNLGCIAARSIQFLPGFGVVRFTHLGFAVFDGINDRLISEDIRPYLFGGVDSEADLVPVDPAYVYLSQSAQTVAPPMYLCAMPLSGQSGALTRLFCYDLVMKSWAVLDLPWAITSMATVAGGEGYPLVLAGKTDGTIQRLQSGDLNWDQGATDQSAVQWSFRTPDLFGEGGTQRLFYERATITGYGSAAMVQSIIANLWLDGQQIGSQAIDIVPQGGSNLFTANVSIFRNGNRAHLDISGNSGGATGVIDSVDWAVTPKSNMARRIIS